MKQLSNLEQHCLKQVKTSYQTYIRLKNQQGSDHLAPKPFLLNQSLPMNLCSNLILQLESDHPENYGIPSALLERYSINQVKEAIELIWANFLDYFDEEQEYFIGITNIQENALCILALDELEADQILNVLRKLDNRDDETESKITEYCLGIIQGIYPHRFYDTYFSKQDTALGVLRAKIFHTNFILVNSNNAVLIIQGNKQVEDLLSKHVNLDVTDLNQEGYQEDLINQLTDQVQEIIKPELEAIK